ncbi:MAG TPA: RsmB/NOP family class I SAM-dependent RNA methyltransferase, partial [Puia sp.]|nr:RsmB/NOP family class I SAM-dependent RNA methyltransferase [Puia sp.]
MNLPEELLASLDGLPGFDRQAFEAVHREGPAVTSIRLNPGKMAGLEKMGGAAGAEAVPWSSFGFYLPQRPSFTFDPVFHAGAYYVQEASGMFLEQALRQTVDLSAPLRVLDLCAAPGGKSTLLQSLLSADSLLVSNEVIRNRVPILEENMVKWGSLNSVVTSCDPADLGRMTNYFDVIVVDAPCSGSGLFRRDPSAAREWSRDNLHLCHQRQQRILADGWPSLKKDGVLIYSTCSYSREENEDILDWTATALGATGLPLDVPEEWKVVETTGREGSYGYRFYPDRLRGEGLFLGCLRKNGGGNPAGYVKKHPMEQLGRKEKELLSGWIRRDLDLACFYQGPLIHGMPAASLPALSILAQYAYIRKAGVALGKLSSKELIPAHDLAVSMAAGHVPALPLSREEALRYLRK